MDAIHKCLCLPGNDKAVGEREIGYFGKNKDRMRYADFRKRGLFVGSGVLEAGCRTVIGQRLKQSGMHWTVRGANSIIALRCCIMSNRWEDEDRRKVQGSRLMVKNFIPCADSLDSQIPEL